MPPRLRLPLVIGLGVTLLTLAFLRSRPAAACSASRYGLFSRQSFPPDGASKVPTNARVVVRFSEGNGYTGLDGTMPVVADDITLRRKGGAPIAVTRELVVVPGNAWQHTAAVIVKPMQPLAPDVTYELLDRHDPIPCTERGESACARVNAPVVFATFTTGAGPDTHAPTFAGLTSLTRGESFVDCDSSACCYPHHARPFSLAWSPARDDVSAGSVLYNVYVGQDPKPVLAFVDGPQLPLSFGCQHPNRPFFPLGEPWVPTAPAGVYIVRAVDWAGNEDGNRVEKTFDPACDAVAAAVDGGSDAADAGDPAAPITPEPGVEPASQDASDSIGSDQAAAMPPAGQADAGTPAPSASSPVPAPAPVPSAPPPAGDACAFVSTAPRGRGPAVLVLAALGLLFRRRRRARYSPAMVDSASQRR